MEACAAPAGPLFHVRRVAVIFSSWRTIGVRLARNQVSRSRLDASLPALYPGLPTCGMAVCAARSAA